MELEANLKLSLLSELYKNLLTDKQQKMLKDFLDNNLSISELAVEYNSTRQAVNDLLKRTFKTLEGYENGINYKELSTSLPYLYTDKIERIEFIAYKGIIDQIVDWFGTDIKVTELNEKQVVISLKASPNAMEHWAMQYINYVEATKPVKLRERIKENIKGAQEKYK